ncbi:MAG TPA: TonB-dependent receptor [Bacteroidota bacterium]|nr:TonB-dependent receptor [Bacteroidota bacterium]
MKRIISLVLVLLSTFSFSAEKYHVKGRIVSRNGEPLPGANIVAVEFRIGTVSKNDGTFALALPAGHSRLRISLLGYRTAIEQVVVTDTSSVVKTISLQEDPIGSSEVVIVGNRATERTIVESPVPIDIIGTQEIKANGYTETTQILRALVPSFNSPQPSLVDGTDHVRPATLRGLGPDQVLVLVNGKRRHTSALIHLNGSVGRGSTGVDLNAIPVSSIDRVEVLRDGASALYGSDAIAGVINIILKQGSGLDASASYGQYLSSFERGYTTTEGNRPVETTNFASGTFDGQRWDGDGKQQTVNASDGRTVNAHLGYGTPIGDGTLYIGGEYAAKGATVRSGLDPRIQYAATDPRELTIDRNTHKFGDGEITDASVFVNLSLPLEEHIGAYAFGGYSNRRGSAAGFYRRANDVRNVPAIYPNGFLPSIGTDIDDIALTAGAKGSIGEWTYDLSESYGANHLLYRVTNSLNTSYWTKSPTEFDAGGLHFAQATTNLDVFRAWDVGGAYPVNAAFGAEYRIERYRISAGQPESYLRGDSATKAIGSQVFPGFLPSNVLDQTRSNIGLYADFDHHLSQRWLVDVAGRFERYSDFGSTVTIKASSRFELAEGISVRGAVSTGYRAPSLAQEYFSSTATTYINGVPNEVGTFPVSSAVAKSLGATELKPEKSVNISAGFTYNADDISFSIDAYQISIKDRIVLTENFTAAAVTTYLQGLGINATGGRFFTNAINTKTSGIDITGRYSIDLNRWGWLRLTAAVNATKTEITNKSSIVTPPALQALTTTPLLGRVEQGRIEQGQPASTYTFQVNYHRADLDAFIRGVRYGSITSFGSNTDLTLDQTYSAKWLFDAEAGYRVFQYLTLAAGVNNIFDVYPDKVLKVNSNSGLLPYSSFSPFGFNGRFVYTRASVSI